MHTDFQKLPAYKRKELDFSTDKKKGTLIVMTMKVTTVFARFTYTAQFTECAQI